MWNWCGQFFKKYATKLLQNQTASITPSENPSLPMRMSIIRTLRGRIRIIKVSSGVRRCYYYTYDRNMIHGLTTL